VNQWQEGWIKLYFPLSFIAFMSVFYYCIKSWTDKFWALLGLVLLLASPLWLANGWLVHADMITAIYTVMTIMLLTIALKKEKISLIVLASLFASIAAFSKRAGAAYFIIELLMLIVGGCLLRLKNPRFLRNAIIAFTVPMIVWSLPFIIFKFNLTSQGHAGDMLWAVGVDYGHRLLVVLLVVVKQLFLSNDWNFLWLLLTLSLLGVIVKRSFEIVFITLLLTGFFIAYILLSVLTTTYYNGLMGDINPYILPMVIIHFFPLCPLLIILCLHQTFEGFKE
jgi:hypothetical protein